MSTGIPYCDETVNAVVGCTPIAAGCKNCWSKELHDMRHAAFKAGRDVPKQYAKPFEETHLLLPERIKQVSHWRKPRRIFWCSTADMFHKDVPDDYIFEMIRTMTFASWHTHLILTKRIERAAKLLTPERLLLDTGQQLLDESIHFGISCSTQKDLDEMAPILFQIPAAHYWISAEPLIEEIYIPEGLYKHGFGYSYQQKPGQIEWIVCGCEKIGHKPGRFCEDEKRWWEAARNIRRHCLCAEPKIKFYMKQGPINGHVVTDPKDFPADLKIREIPE